MKQKYRFLLWHCVIPLGLGLLIYCFFRSGTYIHTLLNSMGLHSSFYSDMSFLLSDFLKYLLPDFLWSYSLQCGMLGILTPKRPVFTIVGVFCFSSLFEVLQRVAIIHGTFDWLDLLMFLMAGLLACQIYKKEKGKDV